VTDTVKPLTLESLSEAAQLIQQGGLVAFPTETVYGLGADATNEQAVKRIFEAKGRPAFNPLIVHISSQNMARDYVTFTDDAKKLADKFWPGPLTLILPLSEESTISSLCTAGLSTLAVRFPSHPTALALIQKSGRPIAAPSANRSGLLSPTSANHVFSSLGDAPDLILEDGVSDVGLESTIVDCTSTPAALLREGGIPLEELRKVCHIKDLVVVSPDNTPKSPGQLLKHYSPRKPIEINSLQAPDDAGVLAFGSNEPGHTRQVLNLSPSADLNEAASNLFAYLHKLDDANIASIHVVPIPDTGIGRAINDRLRRAAEK
jgi:L-threonylcarbamoyladenylate synthase